MGTWYLRKLRQLLALGVRPGDDADERVRKAVLNIFGLLMLFGAPMEAWTAGVEGDRTILVIMASYSVATALTLIHFWRTGRRTLLQRSQFALALLIAAITHYRYGGAASSYGYIMWGSLAPLGALLLASTREARVWTALYCGIASALLVAEIGFSVPMAPHVPAQSLFLVMSVPIGYVLCVIVLVYYFVNELARARVALQDKHAQLQVEQAKGERLLLNILPAAIASRLKDDQRTIAEGYAEVSVLFADIVGFTTLSTRIEPTELVGLLNRLFSAFDGLADRHGVEKIKTIGDAYMAAAGLPERRPDHARAVAEMALGMLTAVADFNAATGHELGIRIGINSGPVVAGVIGRRKFIYDLWGDAVNTASRMESHGQSGRIQVSAATRAALGDAYRFEARGDIAVKGKGSMATWFLLGPEAPCPSAH